MKRPAIGSVVRLLRIRPQFQLPLSFNDIGTVTCWDESNSQLVGVRFDIGEMWTDIDDLGDGAPQFLPPETVLDRPQFSITLGKIDALVAAATDIVHYNNDTGDCMCAGCQIIRRIKAALP